MTRSRFRFCPLRWLLLALLTLTAPAFGQQISSNEAPIDQAFVRAAVRRGAALFDSSYIDPALGRRTSRLLLRNLQQGRYDAITDVHALAARLTADMRTVCPDQHVGWRVRAPQPAAGAPPRSSIIDVKGFYRAEILPGNVGYLEARAFPDERVAAYQLAGAMLFLSGCDALILDFRQHGGGSLLKDVLLGYFFPEPVHVNTILTRSPGTNRLSAEREYSQPVQVRLRRWAIDLATGQRCADTLLVPRKLLQAPVYVLTSPRTFSAAEAVAYELQTLGRGVTVGETTRGGANPLDALPVNERLLLRVPYARVENPVTKTNWEGRGVRPDLVVDAPRALETAHLAALQRRIEQDPGDQARQHLTWDLETARALYQPHVLTGDVARFAGTFGGQTVVAQQGRLFRLDRGYPVALTPLSPGVFVADEELRFEFQADASGAITTLILLRKDGSRVSLPRETAGSPPKPAAVGR